MQKVFQRFISLVLVIFVSVVAFADSRSVEEAQSEAISFLMSGVTGMKHAPSQQSVKLGYTLKKVNSADAAAYLFQIGADNGFVLVSADDNTSTILGYANEGVFDATDIPENMQMWLQHYAEEISWMSEHGVSKRNARKSSSSPISPLLGGIIWNQGAPFWNKCPDDSDGQRSYTGCVATATAQIMRYWKYPQTGTGSHSYVWEKSNGTQKTLSANYGSTTYNWDKMLPSYNDGYTSSEADAVATLMYHVGVAADMMYSSNGSGTFTELSAVAMFTYFGYDKAMRAVRPDYVGFDVFEENMLEELRAGRPVLMSGGTVNNEGHSFVCDGYDGEFFHINWGWGGAQNGYFALSALDPAEQGMGGAASGEGFHVDILGVMGIKPDEGGENTPSSLGTLGLKLNAPGTLKASDTFSISVNQIRNTGISEYEGGIIGLAILDEEDYYVDWFSAGWTDRLPSGHYYGEMNLEGNLSTIEGDGRYKIAPIYTDVDANNFWLMDVGYGSPQYFSFTKTGNTITFDGYENPEPEVDYSVKELTAYSDGSTIYFSFESDAPKFHVKVFNDTEQYANGIIDFKNVRVSNVPDGEWTVWVRPCDEAEQHYAADAVSVSVKVRKCTSISLSEDNIAIRVGQNHSLTATVLPEDAVNKSVAWSSSNTQVAEVDENGVVTAVSVGSATISAATTDGTDLHATCVVTVSPNEYILTYKVDGEVYKSLSYTVGDAITPEAEPTKEGYTFSGWSEIPATMPAHDVEVTGSFIINKYTIKFVNEDGTILQTSEVEYGVTPAYTGATPTKSATAEYSYSFAGWTPEVVAATADATYTASYTSTPNQYKLTYKVDGNIYKEYTLSYGDAITPEAEPAREGYTFSGWSSIPATMPAHDLEVNGLFTANYYKVMYFVNEKMVHEDEVAFGETFELWTYEPEDENLTFNGWIGEKYATMPAYDISYKADITNGIAYIISNPESIQGIYTLNGKKVEKIHQGVYIIRMKDGSTMKFVNNRR